MSKTNDASKDIGLSIYRDIIEDISDQLCKAVKGDFNFTIKTSTSADLIINSNEMNESIQKLSMLINFVIDSARRALTSVEEKNVKLTEMDRLKSDFMANISHELRTPLTLILGPLETILTFQKEFATEHRVNLRRMQRNALRLYMLVNDVLDFSKLEAGKFNVRNEHVKINKMLRLLVEDAQALAVERKINLVFSKCAELKEIIIDKRMVEKIAMNLISNALKFTPEEGTVSVALQKENNMMLLVVKDTGIGIPAAQMERLFERFYQVDSSWTRNYEGTGIGLAIANQFAQLMQGKIEVFSEEGKGTQFTVSLPILVENEVNEIKGETGHKLKRINTSYSLFAKDAADVSEFNIEGKLPLILVVDDNSDMRSYIASLLKETYEIITAKNGKEALELVYKYRPQLILSDVMMPIMDGYQLTKAVKADSSIQQIPVILVTAKSGTDSISRSFNTGADDYICKPFSAEELLARINTAIRSYNSFLKLITLNGELDATNKKLSESLAALDTANQELKTTQTQLIQHSTLVSIGQLSAGVAHEINTPIQYIGDNTRFLKDSFSNIIPFLKNTKAMLSNENKDSHEFLSMAKMDLEKVDIDFLCQEIPEAISQSLEGVVSVSEIVRAMKDFSHPCANEKSPTDINRAIKNTIVVSKNEWKYVANIESELDTALPLTLCLPNEINQVFLNLIVNAAHAIQCQRNPESRKGTIKIQTRKDGEFAEIKISDTGTGIPEAIQNRIFDPFFTTKEIGEGTGQGLAIANAIVVGKHQGQLMFNTKEGEGSTFIVRLPIN